jgi:hypothetical protein
MSKSKIITAGSVNIALYEGLWHLKEHGISNPSRNGSVIQAPGPVLTEYTKPDRRVMFSPLRDANPFFHLYEAVWMLAGANDVASVAKYAKQMEAFSDNGTSLWGAYGWRWRKFFGFDQLTAIIETLRKDPKNRRAVLTMWAPEGDLTGLVVDDEELGGLTAKDVPCNTHVYFDATQGKLEMTVCNRSNDAIWGAYGANMVHMSVLHEFVASAIGLPMGSYYQLSNNFHIYTGREDVDRLFEVGSEGTALVKYESVDLYAQGAVKPYPMMLFADDWIDWLGGAEKLAANPTGDFTGLNAVHHWFTAVFQPLMRSHAAYKAGDMKGALEMAEICAAEDWSLAAVQWLQRRAKKASV